MNSMTIPAEAVEAAGLATHQVLASDWMSVVKALDGSQERYEDLLADIANAALAAALPHMHPTVPNEAEALDALPDGAVIRGMNDDGAVVAENWWGTWRATGGYYSYSSSEWVSYWRDIATWTVLWPLCGHHYLSGYPAVKEVPDHA